LYGWSVKDLKGGSVYSWMHVGIEGACKADGHQRHGKAVMHNRFL
jgi:hypothetical protein